jgi:hypothetical protein
MGVLKRHGACDNAESLEGGDVEDETRDLSPFSGTSRQKGGLEGLTRLGARRNVLNRRHDSGPCNFCL